MGGREQPAALWGSEQRACSGITGKESQNQQSKSYVGSPPALACRQESSYKEHFAEIPQTLFKNATHWGASLKCLCTKAYSM